MGNSPILRTVNSWRLPKLTTFTKCTTCMHTLSSFHLQSHPFPCCFQLCTLCDVNVLVFINTVPPLSTKTYLVVKVLAHSWKCWSCNLLCHVMAAQVEWCSCWRLGHQAPFLEHLKVMLVLAQSPAICHWAASQTVVLWSDCPLNSKKYRKMYRKWSKEINYRVAGSQTGVYPIRAPPQ